MGIDLMQPRSKNFNRNKYYSREYVENMKLQKNATALGVFYSTDKIPLQQQTLSIGNIKKTQYTITLETTDTINELKVDDYVLYNGELWLVESIIANDHNEAKEFSGRPSFVTEISLRK